MTFEEWLKSVATTRNVSAVARAWSLAGWNAVTAQQSEREAKLIADTHVQGQRDMREQIFQACDGEGYIHRSEISNQRLLPSKIAAQVEERDRRVRLEEAEWWHKKLHAATGIPCDGLNTLMGCFKIAGLRAVVQGGGAIAHGS